MDVVSSSDLHSRLTPGSNANSNLSISPFLIPNSRIVHGKAFPLGLQLNGSGSIDIDQALDVIRELAKDDTFKDFLRARKFEFLMNGK